MCTVLVRWILRDKLLVSPRGWEIHPGSDPVDPVHEALRKKRRVRAYHVRELTHLQADWIDERYVEAESSAAELSPS